MNEFTFGMIKPDATERNLIGEIITMIEKAGFQIINAKMMTFSQDSAEKFYKDHVGQPYFENLIKQIKRGPVLGLYLYKPNTDAIEEFRKLIGSTNPANAAPGTIREVYGMDVPNNSIHGSDSLESLNHEAYIFGFI